VPLDLLKAFKTDRLKSLWFSIVDLNRTQAVLGSFRVRSSGLFKNVLAEF